MIRPKKILAPTDLSSLSVPAIRQALEMGLESNAEVVIYNVIGEDGEWFGPDDPLNPAGAFVPRQKERLNAFVQENFSDLTGRVKTVQAVEAGVPYFLIVQKAEAEHADVIVMSTHGRRGCFLACYRR